MADRRLTIRSGWSRAVRAALLVCALLAAAGCGAAGDDPADAVGYVAPQGEPLQTDATIENDTLKLTVERTTGVVSVTDKRNGHVWRGAADKEEAASRDIAGDYKGHVLSPFIVEYHDPTANVNAFKRGNLQSEQPDVKLYRTGDDRVEVAYGLKNGALRFSFRLGLSGASLIVDVPGERILDDPKKAALKSITPYPFLGAVLGTSRPGYLLVPSGPGYLIDFYDNDYPYDAAFNETVYGDDIGFELGPVSPTPVRYPVFGIKRGDGAFVAVVGEGGAYGKLTATPSGLLTPYNWAAAELAYLPDDYLKNAYPARSKQMIEDEVKRLDRRITYTFLAGADADYVGMAKAYRSYLMAEGARKLAPAGKTDPFAITVYQANLEIGMFGRKTVPVTTFAQAEQMLRTLSERGVGSMTAALRGWNDGGDFPGSWPKRFPPDPSLGKADDLKRLAGYARSIGVPLLLYDNYFDAVAKEAGFRPREDALRNVRTGVVERKGDSLNLNSYTRYRLRPDRSVAYLRDALPVYREWGVSGLLLYGRDANSTLHSDFGRDAVTTRSEAAGVQRQMLDEAARELGVSGFASANAYAVGHASMLKGFPIGPGYDAFKGRTVPFYPIAVHGLAAYSGDEANLYADPPTDRLRHIEYGAIPAYTVTHDAASELQYTSARSTLVSTKFDIWRDEIVREYGTYRDRIGASAHLFIEGHRQLADGVYATTYEDGRRVVVNYTDRPYRHEGVDVPARDYAVVPAGKEGGSGG
ncbi:DUF5696 domain-containing protein [Paenibacillus flagellatus]|uniref:Lipoprotein n=1 Tax=Paenibacillus flagellatus TaxID=2211139 RepID=A0A2V5K2I9_9BACL|nr:DUF5696 domain-containing protein [Paenibacillus flagellatus]PYI53371.1 hypothetical protein DLM86_16430 [Paenibacillus flagellatus]